MYLLYVFQQNSLYYFFVFLPFHKTSYTVALWYLAVFPDGLESAW